jgi:molybdenum cofactor cytidylyltransferase
MTTQPKPTRVIALVLAAGHSRRFGADKRRAHLDDGRPLLAATLDLAAQCFEEVWVVLRPGEQPADLGIDSICTVVPAPGDEIGLGTSLGAGASALIEAQPNTAAIAVMLGDMPWIQPATCQALKRVASSERIARPRHAGQPGHPVLFGSNFWPALARLRGAQGAREILGAHPPTFIEVEDAGILRDVDVPHDLSR